MIHTKRIDSLQFVRAIAFLEIFCCHCIWGSGALGVSLFFILSGFLLTYNHVNDEKINVSIKSCIVYAKKKVKNLYPLHITMMLIMIVVYLMTSDYIEWKALFIQICSHTLLVQTWIPNPLFYFSLNGISWYLATCFFTYFMFPVILNIINKYKARKTAIMCIGIIYIIQLGIGIITANVWKIGESMVYYITYICPLYRLGDFIIGCNLGYIFCKRKESVHNKIENNMSNTILEFAALAMMLVSEIVFANAGTELTGVKYSTMFTPVSMFVIFVFANEKGALSGKVKENRIIQFIAKISPYGFLIHLKVITFVRVILSNCALQDKRILIAIIAMGLTIPLSLIYDEGWKMLHKKLSFSKNIRENER